MALAIFVMWFATFVVPIAIVFLVISSLLKKRGGPGFSNKERLILLLGVLILVAFSFPFVSIYLRN